MKNGSIFMNLVIILAVLSFLGCNSMDTSEPDVVEEGTLVLNEFLASNDLTNYDEYGDFDDWVELYNGTEDIIDIAGMYITDDPLDVNPWMIPDTSTSQTTIPPNGFVLLWCDKEPEQGVFHVDIKLSVRGEQIILLDTDMTTVIDSIQFGAMTTGISYGREPDGSSSWTLFSTPTPGSSN